MKLTISGKPAAHAACAAMAARVFCDLMVDARALHSPAWISALLGALLSLPAIFGYRRLNGGKGGVTVRLLEFALTGSNLLGVTVVLSDLARSAGYLTLDRTSPLALLIPAALALIWCAERGEAMGYSATIWLRVFPALMLIVILLQLPRYRPAWLLPILGEGWAEIIKGALRTAGIYSAIAGISLATDDKGKGSGLAMACLAGAAIAAALIALRMMMTPVIRPGGRNSWLIRLDSLLTNGRAPLYLQMPMIAIWYAGLLHAMACQGFTAAALLQRVFPALDGRLCGVFVGGAAMVLALSGVMQQSDMDVVLTCQAAVLTLLAGFAAWRGGDAKCAKSRW